MPVVLEALAAPAKALTVAGSDSGGGAGVQADLKTFTALGVYGMSALTAVTAQNSRAVEAVQLVDADLVARQIDAVAQDFGVDAVKTGMLGSEAIVAAVADRVRANRLAGLVVDPVMVAKSGRPLLAPDAVAALKRTLLPLAQVVTPNLPEAEALTGAPVATPAEMRRAARQLHDLGCRVVVIKGGHLSAEEAEGAAWRDVESIAVDAGAPDGPPPAAAGAGPPWPPHPTQRCVDLVYDGERFTALSGPRFVTRHTHGTGCTFSAALAAGLARGWPVQAALIAAKRFVSEAIRQAWPLGAGHGPTNHLITFSLPLAASLAGVAPARIAPPSLHAGGAREGEA